MSAGPSPLLPLLEALNFAAIKHRDQRRKDPSKTPYINHPIGVAHILAAEGGVSDLATLQVGRLSLEGERWSGSIDYQFGPPCWYLHWLRETVQQHTLLVTECFHP